MNERATILYADDDLKLQQTAAKLLQASGFRVLTADNANSALELLQSHQCECLISDIDMPGNKHLEFISQVAREHPGLPVILVTGVPAVDTAVAAVKLPVAAYLIKPFDFPALLKEIREVMSRSELQSQIDQMNKNLECWHSDLRRLSEGLRQSPRLPLSAPMDVFVTVTYRNILEAMNALQVVVSHALARQGTSPVALENAVPPLALIDALRETIGVLEKTKDAFRSRDLGELRKKLMRLLEP